MLEQVENLCREDEARWKEVRRKQKEMQSTRKDLQGMMTRLDELRDEVEYLEKLEDDAIWKLTDGIPRLSHDREDAFRCNHVISFLYYIISY